RARTRPNAARLLDHEGLRPTDPRCRWLPAPIAPPKETEPYPAAIEGGSYQDPYDSLGPGPHRAIPFRPTRTQAGGICGPTDDAQGNIEGRSDFVEHIREETRPTAGLFSIRSIGTSAPVDQSS